MKRCVAAAAAAVVFVHLISRLTSAVVVVVDSFEHLCRPAPLQVCTRVSDTVCLYSSQICFNNF